MTRLNTAGLRSLARRARRFLHLSPMQSVMKELRKRGVQIGHCDALEVFGWTGEMHVFEYARAVASLEVRERSGTYLHTLERNFPGARIHITDSYLRILSTPRKYDLVVVDNSPVTVDPVEHFDIFPAIFRVLKSPAIIILSVIPKIDSALRSYPEMQLVFVTAGRQAFYGVSVPWIFPFLPFFTRIRQPETVVRSGLPFGDAGTDTSGILCFVVLPFDAIHESDRGRGEVVTGVPLRPALVFVGTSSWISWRWSGHGERAPAEGPTS